MGRVSKKDFRRLANNSAATLADMQQRGHSLAVCFDVLVACLDDVVSLQGGRRFSDKLKEELERRANAVQAGDKG